MVKKVSGCRVNCVLLLTKMADAHSERDGVTMENTFPVYKVDAIVQFFRTDVLTGQEAKHFAKSDITPNPKPEVIQRLYMRILQLLYGFRPECHYLAPLSENIQCPMLYECAIPVMSVYLSMCQFLPMCHVYDFSLNDLLNPKPKRTITILSGIQNFLHFRKQRLEIIAGHQQSFRAEMDKLQAYTRGIKEAEKKIEKLMIIPPEQQAEAKELAAALKEVNSATMQESQEVSAINEQVAECKTEIAERSQKLSQRKLEVATQKDEIAKLKSQIVESPEEVKNEMEKMKENIKNIKNSKELSDEMLVDLQIKVQCASQGESDIQVILKQLHDLQASMCKTNQQKEEVQSLAALSETLQKELKGLSNEEGQLKRALAMKLDKESKQQIRRQKKKELKDQHVQNIIGQYDKIHEKREEIVDRIKHINSETRQFKEKMQKLRDTCNQNSEKAQAIYDRLLTTLEQYHKRIENIVMEGTADMMKMKTVF
ncbi:kinetochore protein Nuf2 isoform X1 [Pygocentrus nattereri]|uniref:Kinetochore protein Nuf2 N-terminal domain-containing protein n=2 Tax=Pygocentrus nattereri TaxID=42514 RepID=A0A3B4DJC2_PYGNA|nr:kinetochore protein Nuf2 isoform X1 [Pygocentrus nattereri]